MRAAVDWQGIGELALRIAERVGSAVLVVLVGFLLALVARAAVRRWMARHERRLGPSVVRLASTSLYYALLGLTCGFALVALGVPRPWVAGLALVVVLVLAIAFRESIGDLAASVLFVIFRPFRRGDMVETLGQVGHVHEMLLFTTSLVREDGAVVALPNRRIHEDGVANLSAAGHVLTQIVLRVPYGTDLSRVRELVTGSARQHPDVLDVPAPELVVAELGEHGMDLVVVCAVATHEFWRVRVELRETLAARLAEDSVPLGQDVRLTLDHETGSPRG